MTDPKLLETIKLTLDRDPRNGLLWSHYADLLVTAGRQVEAVVALRSALELLDEKRDVSLRLVALLRETGDLAEALIRAEAMQVAAAPDPAISLELGRIMQARGDHEEARAHFEAARSRYPDEVAEALALPTTTTGESRPPTAILQPAAAEVTSGGEDDWAAQFDWEDLRVTFADVAGLQDVKRQIDLRIIAPFKNPEVYKAFKRQGGGGLLLYGPPGCGKTFIARATAGECGANFVCVSIHDIVNKYWGESEKMVHAVFEEARRHPPTVLFFDEFDALGSSRGRGESQFWKVLVNQLLQEMDGLEGRNDDLLVFAATNMPWNVDSAFRRPGRFDRVLFVPPPDTGARASILAQHAARLPGGEGLELQEIAKQTALFTGADLKSLAERAAERALEASLADGAVHPVTLTDFTRELQQMNSSASEWLSTARNHAKYANDGGQYDELREFLQRVKKW